MKNRLGSRLKILAAAVLISTGAAFAAEAPRPFDHPDRIHYDSHCMTIDGKDTVIYSGAFHYFRCPKELWRDRFEKIKAAGFNTVETYIAWNRQEVEAPAGLDDFSKVDLRDVEDWLNMADEFGLYVIIRPGPYICAEWDRGGFPGWLTTKRPASVKQGAWFRSDEPEFVAWSKHWYDAVCPMLAKHQITRKKPGEPGIIMFQLENEYDYSGKSEEVKMAYVKALAEAAMAKGIDVPMFTCWTRSVRGNPDPVLRRVFDSCNFYPGWNVDYIVKEIHALDEKQSDAPRMTTELQGGWFTGVRDPQPLQPDADHYRADLVPAQVNNLTLLAWQDGETITNYYMLFGGTNITDGAAQGISTTYDYSCPIRENGGVGEKYLTVTALGQIIREHGAQLARADLVHCESETGAKDVSVVVRRSPDGSRFIFLRTNQHAEPRSGTVQVKEKGAGAIQLSFDYQLEKFGSKLLYLPPGVSDPAKGEWYPKVQPAIDRPGELPSPIKITEVQYKADPGPSEWKSLEAGKYLNELGIYDSRFVYYHGTLKVQADDQKTSKLSLRIEHPGGEHISAVLNGHALAPADGSGRVFNAGDSLHPGDNDLSLLYENSGYSNGGPGNMEKLAGVGQVRVMAALGREHLIGNWEMQSLSKYNRPERTAKAALKHEGKWTKVAVEKLEANQLQPDSSAIFQASVDLTDQDLRGGWTALSVGRMDDEGWVFVNGEQIGQGHIWNESYTCDASKQLHAGHNVICIIVHNSDGIGGLGPVSWATAQQNETTGNWMQSYSDVSAGVVGTWTKTDLDDSAWTKLTLPAAKPEATAMLSWQRLSFEVPPPAAGTWVPWLVRLHPVGEGFIYLNGHFLGRCWDHGGQFDYYMPECWLNFGPGKKNVVALCLRPTEKGVGLDSAEVIPYTYYAEKRAK